MGVDMAGIRRMLYHAEHGAMQFSHLESLNVSRYAREFDQLERLGAGAFGSVYKARHKLDGGLYAIKSIAFDTQHHQQQQQHQQTGGGNGGGNGRGCRGGRGRTDPQQRLQKVLREIRCLAMLDHPHVNRYYSAWLEPVWLPAAAAKATATLRNRERERERERERLRNQEQVRGGLGGRNANNLDRQQHIGHFDQQFSDIQITGTKIKMQPVYLDQPPAALPLKIKMDTGMGMGVGAGRPQWGGGGGCHGQSAPLSHGYLRHGDLNHQFRNINSNMNVDGTSARMSHVVHGDLPAPMPPPLMSPMRSLQPAHVPLQVLLPIEQAQTTSQVSRYYHPHQQQHQPGPGALAQAHSQPRLLLHDTQVPVAVDDNSRQRQAVAGSESGIMISRSSRLSLSLSLFRFSCTYD